MTTPTWDARRGLAIGTAAWLAVVTLAAAGCGNETSPGAGPPSVEVVRERIAALAPSANLGHRGTGINTATNPWAENSLASFEAAIDEGADGIELDVELTSDLQLVVMHDDTLNRTTTCQGCVNAMSFAQVRQCRLLDGSGRVTTEPPPTLEETYAAIPADALVNVELKVFDPGCETPTTGATVLAERAAAEIRRLGVGDRTLFSSFDSEAAAAIKRTDPELYSALLISGLRARNVDLAIELGLDAIHPGGPFPLIIIPAELIADALSRGLQVNVWTVNEVPSIESMIAAGATSIITDEPEVVRAVIGEPTD